MNIKGESTLSFCEQKLKYFNYSEHTIRLYIHYINQFLLSQSKSAVHLNADDFNNYLLNYKFTSVSQQNQIINAIRFLYSHVLERKYDKVTFTRPRSEKKLPVVIDHNHIITSLQKIGNIKHKAILSLVYSIGLRVSEVVNLKIEDIDSQRMLIYIKNAKGKKDRIVPLSKTILELLREYFKQYRPNIYLFNGAETLQYSIRSCQNIFKKYIDSNSHIHILRHSCFTHLLESGTDLRIIQKIAGHRSTKTTEIYTHVSNNLLSSVALPL